MKNLNNFGVHWKIRFLGGQGVGSWKKQYGGGNCLKREGDWYPNAHYANFIEVPEKSYVPFWRKSV